MIFNKHNIFPILQLIGFSFATTFIILLPSEANANEYELKGKQETPDPLFQSVTPKRKSSQNRDNNLYLKHKNAKKIDTQITPDLLEQSLDKKEGVEADTSFQEIFKTITGNKKDSKEPSERSKQQENLKYLEQSSQQNKKTKLNSNNQLKPGKKYRNEQITPDPLLDDI